MDNRPKVVFSLRYAEAESQANELQAALVERGINAIIVKGIPGGPLHDDIMIQVSNTFSDAALVVVLGTRTYGKRTVACSTYQELQYTYAKNKNVFLIKMCENFEEPSTRMILHDLIPFERWLPGTARPDDLVDKIVKELNQACVKQRDEALKERDEATKQRDEAVMERNKAAKQRNEALKELEDIKGVKIKLESHIRKYQKARKMAEAQRDEALMKLDVMWQELRTAKQELTTAQQELKTARQLPGRRGELNEPVLEIKMVEIDSLTVKLLKKILDEKKLSCKRVNRESMTEKEELVNRLKEFIGSGGSSVDQGGCKDFNNEHKGARAESRDGGA